MLRQFSTYAGAILLGGLLILLRYHSAAGEPAPATVEGIVTYQGEPVSHAFITFKCRGMSESLYGQTDEEGHYKLYSRMEKTLPIGKYAVTIVKRINQEEPREPREHRRRHRHWGDYMEHHVVDVLPSHYGDGPTSGLIAIIEPGENVFDWVLSDDKPAAGPEKVASDNPRRFELN